MTEIENGFAEIACTASFVGHAEGFLPLYAEIGYKDFFIAFGKPDDELPPKVLI
jgi:hypothetical protein